MDHETVEKEAFHKASSHAVPVSDDKRGAIQTGVPVLSNPGEACHAGIYEVFQKNPGTEHSCSTQDTLKYRIVPPGVDGKRSANAADPKDDQKYCIEGVLAALSFVLLGMVLCAVVTCLWRKRKR
ncbi:unnamed protein product [Bubo scandiacus]